MLRIPLLILPTVLCGTSLVHAQVAPAYFPPATYAPGYINGQGATNYPMPYPQQPLQQVSYINSPIRQTQASYYTARGNYPGGNYGYNNSYGVNYFYAKNPQGFSPTPAPYSAVANNRALGHTSGWPAPPGADAVAAADATCTDPGPLPGTPRPEIKFHRQTNECVWATLDFMGTFIRPMSFAGPLLTTGSPFDPQPGAIGQPSTAVLFGDKSVDYNLMPGFRAEFGMFIDQCDRFSVDCNAFYVLQQTQSYTNQGDAVGNPVLTRPIFKSDTGTQGGLINSLFNAATGTFQAETRSQFGGIEVNFRCHQYVRERLHTDYLFGFRYVRMGEQLQTIENIRGIQPGFLTFLGQPIALNETLIDDDLFRTTNQFFGPQIGARMSWEQQWLTTTLFAKIGVGATHQQTTISGSTTKLSPLGDVVAQGSVIALPTNIGNHSRTVFGILPEMGFNIGVDVTQCVRLKLGYSLMLWNKVVRPGSQYDFAVNPSQIPGNAAYGLATGPMGPIYRFNDEFFWAQSLNLGVEVHY